MPNLRLDCKATSVIGSIDEAADPLEWFGSNPRALGSAYERVHLGLVECNLLPSYSSNDSQSQALHIHMMS